MAWRLSVGLRNKLLGAASGQGSLKQIMANGQIRIYTGNQPANAELGETGTLLCTITLASGAMTSGVGTNGINIDNAAAGAVGKPSGETWSGVNAASGTAGYFTWLPNTFNDHLGAATDGNKIRIRGNCGTSGAQMNLTSTNLVEGITTTIQSLNLTLPTL